MNTLKLLLLALLFPLSNIAQLTLLVTEIPPNTPDGSDIYVAGNFQAWNPGDPNYQLELNFNGDYELVINPAPGTLAFKFTRGSWENPEGNENGGFLPDRTFEYDGTAQTLELQILTWEDTGGLNSTATDNVSILDTDYSIPQLNRERRIWIYLPPDYDTALDKHYPVLYMHDGQNLFDAATSFSGEWEVDETLNALHEEGDYGCIVVGIDNGGVHRLDEYSPWVNTEYGGGQGDDYLQFLVNTLKPDIDANYRTLSAREHTGIMGSSMGGLISVYGGMEYNSTFSKIGSFSPAYWFAPECISHAENSTPDLDTRVYHIIGLNESLGAVEDMSEMDDALLEAGIAEDELSSTVHLDGQHSEWYWAREFGEAYEWLFRDLELSISDSQAFTQTMFYPNPVEDKIAVQIGLEIEQLEILDLTGRTVHLEKSPSSEVILSGLEPGKYLVRFYMKSGAEVVREMVKY